MELKQLKLDTDTRDTSIRFDEFLNDDGYWKSCGLTPEDYKIVYEVDLGNNSNYRYFLVTGINKTYQVLYRMKK